MGVRRGQDVKLRNVRLLVIGATLFLDNILLTSIVPILPEVLYDFEHPNNTLRGTESSLLEINNNSITQNVTATINSELSSESSKIGWLLAMKPIIHILFAPIVGSWTHKIGFTIPMFLGVIDLFFTTLVFAFAENYWLLFIARSCQGIGSALMNVSGLAMVAAAYDDENERQKSFSFAISAVALGIIVGPIYGAFSYEFWGKTTPFLILAVPIFFIILVQWEYLKPKIAPSYEESSSIFTLIRDPYILLTAAAITMANLGYGILETALPLRMLQVMNASRWQQGIIFFPATLGYIISNNIFSRLHISVHRRWIICIVGLVLSTISLSTFTFARTTLDIVLPNMFYGFAVGLVDCSMIPHFSYLVDLRHTSVYGNVYAIGDLSFCVSYALGPVFGGTLLKLVGYDWMLYITALLCILFSPIMMLLRDPPRRSEQLPLVGDK